ncbi:MAG: hypothetical protein ACXWE7_12550 [Nitrososphaeraceae archaeon]
MNSKTNSIVITSILVFVLIAGIPTVFENVFAQEGTITSEDSINDTMSSQNKTFTSNANTDFSAVNAVNDTMSGENITNGLTLQNLKNHN